MKDLHRGALIDGLAALLANIEIAALVFRRSAFARTLARAHDCLAYVLVHGDITRVRASRRAGVRSTDLYVNRGFDNESFRQIAALNHDDI